MRSKEEILAARAKLADLMGKKPDVVTKAILNGMSIALQWACNDGGITLERIMNGESIRTHTSEEVQEKLNEDSR